ncbi:cytosine deaminase [Aequitasia blattaphilus]|uniref:Cytosine deaminase n=1 Tax=Aequitasia blattaphilus TaxID=2949332 RepID=A0ABT1E4P9_9FIRM|nr:cytosine deaminase [Aequitasia blattaphilus]MCP1100819.1 cytosine deaminase [Aequitasia blattaphilus]MCR8613459.1 cytosine deaminase [Aequitasia blattaphilus]
MLLKGLHIENNKETSDVRIEDGLFKEIAPSLTAKDGEEVKDYFGKLALPPFIESHVHLDTCLTAGQPCWNESGTLFEGIECWSKRKESLTKEDVKERVRRAIKMQVANGVQFVRTHVDTTDPKLTAMEALIELREEFKDHVTIQIVAFPQEGILSYPNGAKLLEESLRMGADAVGAIPHYEFTREYSVESLNMAMKLAEKYDVLVDVHCDEIDDEASRGLETLATRALESGMKDRVTASHTTAMHSYNNAYTLKLFRLLTMSEINFVCNPLVNTHLQGRTDTYPRRRGVTRVKELLANNCNVSMGHDDIFDPWYPLGTGNMMDVVFMGLHVCQMMGYQEILDSYKLVTTNAAKTLHLGENYGIAVGRPANLIVLDGSDFYQTLNQKGAVLASYRTGRLISETIPAVKQLYI